MGCKRLLARVYILEIGASICDDVGRGVGLKVCMYIKILDCTAGNVNVSCGCAQ